MLARFAALYNRSPKLSEQPSDSLLAKVRKHLKGGTYEFIGLSRAVPVIRQNSDGQKQNIGNFTLQLKGEKHEKYRASSMTFLYHLRVLLNAYLIASTEEDTPTLSLDGALSHLNIIEEALRYSAEAGHPQGKDHEIFGLEKEMRTMWHSLSASKSKTSLDEIVEATIQHFRSSFPTETSLKNAVKGGGKGGAGPSAPPGIKANKVTPAKRTKYAEVQAKKAKKDNKPLNQQVCYHHMMNNCRYGDQCLRKHD